MWLISGEKMVKENKSARPVFGNELSLHNIAHNYVVHVLDVKENDSNFRNPVHLFHKSVIIGSSSSSDIARIINGFQHFTIPQIANTYPRFLIVCVVTPFPHSTPNNLVDNDFSCDKKSIIRKRFTRIGLLGNQKGRGTLIHTCMYINKKST